MARRPEPNVQADAPRALPTRVRTYDLRVEDIRPALRIAHRAAVTLRIRERIILDHELVLITRGTGTVRERRADGVVEHALAPRTLLCIPPFVPHDFAAVGEGEHLAVHFDWAAGVPRAQALERRSPYRVRLAQDLALPFRVRLAGGEGVGAALHEVVRLWQLGSPVAQLGAQARLQGVLAELLLGPAATGGGDAALAERMRRALALIDERCAEPLTHGDLARFAGLGPSRFAEVFRAWTGHAPKDWLRRVRVERARRLLVDPRLSVREVGERCGFPDPYHFSRVFRRYDGLSPSAWRDAALAGRTGSGDGDRDG